MPKNNYKPEAHVMNKRITQATQNDKQISKSIKRFFTRFHISSALKAVYGKGNPMITGHLGSSFYTFLTKCLISHGYRLFKYCFKCSEQCFQITLNFQTKKSMNWRVHLWCTSYDDENTTAGCIKAEHWQLNNCQILNFQCA